MTPRAAEWTPSPVPVVAVEPASESSPDALVAVNQASAEEIEALKGINRNVAKAIVESRPFDSVDDLIRVKGIGPKLLERLRRIFRV